MLGKDTPIVIKPVANGFVVRPESDRGVFDKEVSVFQSMSGLITFIKGHFNYRSEKIKTDLEV